MARPMTLLKGCLDTYITIACTFELSQVISGCHAETASLTGVCVATVSQERLARATTHPTRQRQCYVTQLIHSVQPQHLAPYSWTPCGHRVLSLSVGTLLPASRADSSSPRWRNPSAASTTCAVQRSNGYARLAECMRGCWSLAGQYFAAVMCSTSWLIFVIESVAWPHVAGHADQNVSLCCVGARHDRKSRSFSATMSLPTSWLRRSSLTSLSGTLSCGDHQARSLRCAQCRVLHLALMLYAQWQACAQHCRWNSHTCTLALMHATQAAQATETCKHTYERCNV